MTIANGHSPLDGYSTRAIHVGSEPDPTTGAVVPSLSVATTFLQDGVDRHRGHDYSRSSNPTRSLLEGLLTSLETGDSRGSDSLVFASGSAATAAIASWVSLSADEGGAGGKDGTGGGGHVLAVNDVVRRGPAGRA
jgi:cystathionine gamma-lyase